MVMIVLALAALACNLPSQGNLNPTPVVPFSEEEAQQFEQDLQETLVNPQAGSEVTITLEERQLNSYLATRLASQTDQVLSNPRVRLTGGRMEVTVQVKQGITVDAKAVVVPTVDNTGQPRLQVESAALGALPLPETVVNQLQEMVDKMLIEILESSNSSFKITKIEITEGKMLVTGVP
jgi:uncharacterized protein YpmS